MRKIVQLAFIAIAAFFVSSTQLSAQDNQPSPDSLQQSQPPRPRPGYRSRYQQKKQTDSYFDESGDFKHRLWYGGTFGINYTTSIYGYGQFYVSVNPLVGYKITKNFSVGPRLGLSYTTGKTPVTSSAVVNANYTDFSVGLFARYKVFNHFFVHVETNQNNIQNINYYDPNTNTLSYVRNWQTNNYIGAGYSSGGIFGYEIMILYNLSVNPNDPNDYRAQIEPRIGFNYNF